MIAREGVIPKLRGGIQGNRLTPAGKGDEKGEKRLRRRRRGRFCLRPKEVDSSQRGSPAICVIMPLTRFYLKSWDQFLAEEALEGWRLPGSEGVFRLGQRGYE